VTTPRARAREATTAEIKYVARRQLADNGASGLSLRAVARDVGMVSSAVYRYFRSRDELLTALIVDGYDALGQAAESAEAQVPRQRTVDRWLAATSAVRSWALERPHEWALLFGSPVPGYAAPQDTIGPASRVPLLLLSIIRSGTGQPKQMPRLPRPLAAELRAIGGQAPLMARSVMAWTHLIGSISLELFGHLENTIDERSAWFEVQMRAVAADVGITDPHIPTR
jgi:AcrR family transcriptional regulator